MNKQKTESVRTPFSVLEFLIKISFVFDLVRAIGKQMSVKIDKVIVGHTCDKINDELIWLGFFVWQASVVMSSVGIIDMMRKYG